jgi:hypothetical protein
MAFLPIVIGFVAVLIGVLGPSRVTDASGVTRTTLFGWASIALALASAVVAGMRVRAECRARSALEARLQKIASAAQTEIAKALGHVEDVLRFALAVPAMTHRPGEPKPPVTVAMSKTLALSSEEAVASLKGTAISPRRRLSSPYTIPFGRDQRCVDDVISEESCAAKERLDIALSKCNPELLPISVFEGVHEVSEHRFLDLLMTLSKRAAERRHLEDSEVTVIRLLDPPAGIEHYLGFVAALERLQAGLAAAARSDGAAG